MQHAMGADGRGAGDSNGRAGGVAAGRHLACLLRWLLLIPLAACVAVAWLAATALATLLLPPLPLRSQSVRPPQRASRCHT